MWGEKKEISSWCFNIVTLFTSRHSIIRCIILFFRTCFVSTYIYIYIKIGTMQRRLASWPMRKYDTQIILFLSTMLFHRIFKRFMVNRRKNRFRHRLINTRIPMCAYLFISIFYRIFRIMKGHLAAKKFWNIFNCTSVFDYYYVWFWTI